MFNNLSILIVFLSIMPSACRYADESYGRLVQTFDRASHIYPSDSASLHNFYFEWVKTRDDSTTLRQISRLETLLSEKVQNKYHKVELGLKPLLDSIIQEKTVTRAQAIELVSLYSIYDHLSSEALFSRLLREDDNYQLVWKSFDKLAEAAKRDAFFITALISLDDTITTNVELAESMSDFVKTAIRNNPKGFLEMYAKSDDITRKQLSEYISLNDESDNNLISIFEKLSHSAKVTHLATISKELIGSLKNRN